MSVVDITNNRATDTTFFCIDVDENHNFVTAGGVVHNCRPPGNRDPLPEEIQACESHLFRQIELIQPTLVATLGNFATKLLSGKPAGITQVHGREQHVVLGGNDVTLYPIFHPAAALYTPRMLQVLEEDFARIPELLGRQVEAVPEPEPAPPGSSSRSSSASSSLHHVEVVTASPEETEALAAELAATLRAGDVVAVSGDLGAGKTTFVRGAARALGVVGPISSPTFTIGHRYDGARAGRAPRSLPAPGPRFRGVG